MEGKEIYKQKEGGLQEDMERMKAIDYPNFVSESILGQFSLGGKKVLDSGSGPNAKLAEYVSQRGGMYVPMDVRNDALKNIRGSLGGDGIPFFGVQGDVRQLPFAEDTFDITHQRFVLMNIAPETRLGALRELLRVTREELVLLEYNWRTMKSTGHPEIIERFRELAFKAFAKFSTDPYMGEKFQELFNQTDADLKYELKSFRREEDVKNSPELLLTVRGLGGVAENVLKDAELARELKKLAADLEHEPIAFEPPEVVVATIKKEREELYAPI